MQNMIEILIQNQPTDAARVEIQASGPLAVLNLAYIKFEPEDDLESLDIRYLGLVVSAPRTRKTKIVKRLKSIFKRHNPAIRFKMEDFTKQHRP